MRLLTCGCTTLLVRHVAYAAKQTTLHTSPVPLQQHAYNTHQGTVIFHLQVWCITLQHLLLHNFYIILLLLQHYSNISCEVDVSLYTIIQPR